MNVVSYTTIWRCSLGRVLQNIQNTSPEKKPRNKCYLWKRIFSLKLELWSSTFFFQCALFFFYQNVTPRLFSSTPTPPPSTPWNPLLHTKIAWFSMHIILKQSINLWFQSPPPPSHRGMEIPNWLKTPAREKFVPSWHTDLYVIFSYGRCDWSFMWFIFNSHGWLYVIQL